MNFEESQKYLYSLGNEVLAMKLGLENISILLNELGNPHEKYKKVQIAGTNGKGSTVAFLESICLQAGIEVGATTSPHLVSVTERVRINGREISEEDFARLTTKVRETAERLVIEKKLESVPTYFEQVTAIALLVFAEAGIELAILETGLGGRFDATTAAKAEIVAITPIDLDHQQILGNTLAEIAAEKAAIIRADTKAIIAPQKIEAKQIIEGKCLEVGVEPIWTTERITSKVNNEDVSSIVFTTFETGSNVYPNIVLGLKGKHQTINAATAISIAENLNDLGFKITHDNICNGLETAKHKGRLEFYKDFLFDGAHNIAGAKALREYFDEFVKQPITMIFGTMRDKDLTEIAEILFPKAETLILTKPDNPRSMDVADLLEFVPKNFSEDKIIKTQTVAEALEAIKNADKKSLICVTGSLYLVGEVQKYLDENYVLSTNSSNNS